MTTREESISFRALIFDFNGVICDDESVQEELFHRILREEGITLKKADYDETYLGLSDREAFQIAFKTSGRAVPDGFFLDQLILRKSAYYREVPESELMLCPGVAEVVRGAACRCPMAVGSAALRGEIESFLVRTKLIGCFAAIVSAEDVTHWKPHPETFLKALSLLNASRHESVQIEPNECLVIEDSRPGIEAAVRAGMKCLRVKAKYNDEILSEADWSVRTLLDQEVWRILGLENTQGQ